MPSIIEHSTPRDGYWEYGAIIIPRAEWGSFKNFCRNAYIEEQTRYYKAALEIYDKVKAEGFGKRRFPYYSRCLELLKDYRYSPKTAVAVVLALFPYHNDKLYKPARCRFDWTPDKNVLIFGKWALHMNDETHSLQWRYQCTVSRNPYDYAIELESVCNIKRALRDIEYFRGTGGIQLSCSGTVGYGPLGQAMVGPLTEGGFDVCINTD